VQSAEVGGRAERGEVDEAGGIVDVDCLEGGRDLVGDVADDLPGSGIAGRFEQGNVVAVLIECALVQQVQVVAEE
jgi:hypothetical protein